MSRTSIALLAIILLSLGSVCGSQDQEYVIYYLEYSRSTHPKWDLSRGKLPKASPFQVTAFNTMTGESSVSTFAYQDKIRHEWCNPWDSLGGRPDADDTLPVAWSEVPEIKKLVAKATSMVPPAVDLHVETGPLGTCFPQKGIQAVGGAVVRPDLFPLPPGNRDLISFRCIYDNTTGEVILVDATENKPVHQTDSWMLPFFDANGESLYYYWFGLGKRFHLATHHLDTISAGEIPIIPWNELAIVVFNGEHSKYRLLGDNLGIMSEISGALSGEVTSAYKVSDSVIVFGAKYRERPEPLMLDDPPMLTTFYELDFGKHRVKRLAGDIPVITQIIGVEPI